MTIRRNDFATEADCAVCRNFQPIANGRGQCRRLPPTVTANGTSWPITAEDDWCGEFKRIGDPPAETMSIPEAGAAFYGLSKNGSYNAANRGDIPTIRVGRLRRVPVAKLMQMVAR